MQLAYDALSGLREPGRGVSALLAVIVHVAFFAFLYFGVNWHPKVREPLVAELWSELPPVRKAVPEPQPAPPPEARPSS